MYDIKKNFPNPAATRPNPLILCGKPPSPSCTEPKRVLAPQSDNMSSKNTAIPLPQRL